MQKKTFTNLSVFILLLLAVGIKSQSLEEIPQDSINAEEMRIWVPMERVSSTLRVMIKDSKGQLVRKLVDQVYPVGYYNFYFDKKDDSGHYLEEGSYQVEVSAGQYKKSFPIKIAYRPGENGAYFYPHEDKPEIGLSVLSDSLSTTLLIETRRGMVLDTMFVDSMLNRGEYKIVWEPSEHIPNNYYIAVFEMGQFKHYIKFRLKR